MEKVRHEMGGGCGAVPVPFVAWCVDHVAGPDREDVAAVRLHKSCAFGDVEGLTDVVECQAVRAPGVK